MNHQCDLELENNNLSFTQITMQLMMYHPIKSGCKKISTSVDVVKTVICDCMSPYCDPELEASKPIFLLNTLVHDDADHHTKFAYRRFSSRGLTQATYACVPST